MTQKDSRDLVGIREVLINAVEVELAALRTSVYFWRQWIAQTSEHIRSTAMCLSTIRSKDRDASQVLLELVDSSRERMRTLTELPRNAAVQFIRELDVLEEKKRFRGRTESATEAPGARGARTEAAEGAGKARKRKRVATRRARAKP
jgi:hypothetical protein